MANQHPTIATLLNEEPAQWGTRGDPYLWEAMQAVLDDTPLPSSLNELDALLQQTYEELTGHSTDYEEPFFVERFSHGGMSSGYISPEFWVHKAFPLLKARYHQTMNHRFTLEPRQWYACEIIGDEFDDDKCSYSPIKVISVMPAQKGNRTFSLDFYHANYPEGVRDKTYTLQTIERGSSFLLAKAIDYEPVRLLQIYEISPEWVTSHFPSFRPDDEIQRWLERNM